MAISNYVQMKFHVQIREYLYSIVLCTGFGRAVHPQLKPGGGVVLRIMTYYGCVVVQDIRVLGHLENRVRVLNKKVLEILVNERDCNLI
jgi:hypothetical protein